MNPSDLTSIAGETIFSRRAFLEASALATGAVCLSSAVFAPEGAYAAQPESSTTGLAPYAKPAVNDAQDRLSDKKRLLVVVDYQVDFVDGVFGRIEPAAAIEDALYDRVHEYQERGDIVIYTMDTHPQDNYAETREGQVNPPHCIPGTEGWEVYGRLHELLTPEKAIRVMKGTYGSPELPFIVQSICSQGIQLEYIEIAGVSTTCRVLNNAIILYNFFPELPFVMDINTTASYSDEATADQLDELDSWGFIIKH